MALLMDLPNEILDKIICLVLLASRPAYTFIQAAEPSREPVQSSRDMFPRGGYVRYERVSPPIAGSSGPFQAKTTPLLLTSKALNACTEAALARCFPHGQHYELDALFVKESELWPTLTNVPALSEKVASARATIRIVGSEDGSDYWTMFRQGDGGPLAHVYLWWTLLEKFLTHGPVSMAKEDSMDRTEANSKPRHKPIDITVQNIEVNFRVGDLTEDETKRLQDTNEAAQLWWNVLSRRRERPKDEHGNDVTPMLHPRWLAKVVAGQLGSILNVDYHTAKYGMPLFEHVGYLRVTWTSTSNSTNHDHDGTTEESKKEEETHLVREWDVGKILASLSHVPSPAQTWQHADGSTYIMGHLRTDCRIPIFWNWKFQTMREREKKGLPGPRIEDVWWPSLKEWRAWKASIEGHRKEFKRKGYKWFCDEESCHCRADWLEKWLVRRDEKEKIVAKKLAEEV